MQLDIPAFSWFCGAPSLPTCWNLTSKIVISLSVSYSPMPFLFVYCCITYASLIFVSFCPFDYAYTQTSYLVLIYFLFYQKKGRALNAKSGLILVYFIDL